MPDTAEALRLDAVDALGLFDGPREAALDRLTDDAAAVAGCPSALVSLVGGDRLWFAGATGAPGPGGPRRDAPCDLVARTGAPVLVEDLADDPRFPDGGGVAAAAGVRAYAGMPITTPEGLTVGSLCVLDTRPRSFDEAVLRTLRALADSVATWVEATRAHRSAEPGAVAQTCRAELARALLADEFRPDLQPVVDLATGDVVGAEALVRWHRGDGTVLGPAAFLPAMEHGTLAVGLGRRVLAHAAAAARDLDRARPGFRTAVNVSGAQLCRPGLADDVLAALALAGAAPDSLVLELTETAGSVTAVAASELGRLRAAGVGVAIDDFGAGWSSLTRLLELPVTALKIDRSVTVRAATDRRAAAAVAGIAHLAREWGLDVVAEGIETPAQADGATRAGCSHGQGWLFGRPVEPAALLHRLGAGSAAA